MTAIPVPAGALVGIDYLNEVARAHWRKNTAKAVANTVAETDLLNGEISIDGGAMSIARGLRLTALGDLVNNSGATRATPQFKLKFGTTTLLDTGALAAAWGASATRYSWRAVAEIINLGANNSQWASLAFDARASVVQVAGNFVTGEGYFQTVNSTMAALGGGAGAVNTALAQPLVLSVILPFASAALDVTLKAALVEII